MKKLSLRFHHRHLPLTVALITLVGVGAWLFTQNQSDHESRLKNRAFSLTRQLEQELTKLDLNQGVLANASHLINSMKYSSPASAEKFIQRNITDEDWLVGALVLGRSNQIFSIVTIADSSDKRGELLRLLSLDWNQIFLEFKSAYSYSKSSGHAGGTKPHSTHFPMSAAPEIRIYMSHAINDNDTFLGRLVIFLDPRIKLERLIKESGGGLEVYQTGLSGIDRCEIQTEVSSLEGLRFCFKTENRLFNKTTAQLILNSGMMALLIALIVFAMTWLLTERFINPFFIIFDHLKSMSLGVYRPLPKLPLTFSDFASHFNQNLIEIEKSKKLQQELELSEARSHIAKQVSHDIRSPLTALNMVLIDAHDFPEDKRILIRTAVQRINDIANSLLKESSVYKVSNHEDLRAAKKKMTQTEEPHSIRVSALLDSIVSEKRLQYRDRDKIEIHSDLGQGYGLFADIDPIEFQRAISNLINNSVEAIEDTGHVTISVRGSSRYSTIFISDNGKGIPNEILLKLGHGGPLSFGKKGEACGFGMGIPHAQSLFERAGGLFSIQSKIEHGTVITISLPKATPPQHFVSEISLTGYKTIVSVDDDKSIHTIWEQRFLRAHVTETARLHYLSFQSTDEFSRWFHEQPNREEILILMDYEFIGKKINGLDVVRDLNIAGQSFLVTSRHDDQGIIDRALRMNIRIIPKTLCLIVPIITTNKKVNSLTHSLPI